MGVGAAVDATGNDSGVITLELGTELVVFRGPEHGGWEKRWLAADMRRLDPGYKDARGRSGM